MKTLLGIVLGGICGFPVGFGFSFALYGLSFLITRGQGQWSDNGLWLWFSSIVSPLLITPLAGAVVGAKIMKRKPV